MKLFGLKRRPCTRETVDVVFRASPSILIEPTRLIESRERKSYRIGQAIGLFWVERKRLFMAPGANKDPMP